MATESFFSSASLALLASAGASKDGKVYSIKPNDGTGDFTFSRGSNLAATRVGADGLIEKGRENLLLQSNSFDTSPWFNINTTEVGGQSGYDGSSDAWLITKSAASAYIGQNISQGGVTTFSVYAKANDSDYMEFLCDSGAYQFFNLSNGTLGVGNAINATIEAVGATGWYRCSMAQNASITRVRIFPAEVNTTSGTSGSIYIQDAQLEIGLAVTDVISTGATTGKAGLLEDEPRFDYSGGATCPSLLLEPSRTNVLGYSEYFDGWNLFNNMTPTANDAISPEGLQNAYKIETTAGGAYFREPETLTAGYNVFSIFVKRGNSQYIFLRTRFFIGGEEADVWFDVQSGTKGGNLGASVTYDIEDYGNGWYRCYLVHNVDAGDLFGYAYVGLSNTDEDVIGESGLNGYFYGGQWEAGSYPTSYIPNHSGGSVTRGEDDSSQLDVTGLTSTYNTLFAEFEVSSTINQGKIALSDDSSSNRMTIIQNNNDLMVLLNAGGSAQTSITATSVLSVGANFKVAVKNQNGSHALFVNGTKIGEESSTTPTGLNKLRFGNELNSVAVQKFLGDIKQTLVFPEALSDADCIAITSL